MTFLSSTDQSKAISFTEFRDFLLLMPRKASTLEIYRYYELRKSLGDDGHGAARVNMEGILNLVLVLFLVVHSNDRGCFIERRGSPWNNSEAETTTSYQDPASGYYRTATGASRGAS